MKGKFLELRFAFDQGLRFDFTESREVALESGANKFYRLQWDEFWFLVEIGSEILN